MKIKPKIFEILVAVTFLIGQVQYIRTTYFCTEQLRTVNRPSAEMNSFEPMSKNETCDECQGFIPFYHGYELAPTNCIQVHTFTKSIINNFTISDKPILNPAGIAWVQNKLSILSYRPSAISLAVINCDASPPSDIPIANNNLRI